MSDESEIGELGEVMSAAGEPSSPRLAEVVDIGAAPPRKNKGGRPRKVRVEGAEEPPPRRRGRARTRPQARARSGAQLKERLEDLSAEGILFDSTKAVQGLPTAGWYHPLFDDVPQQQAKAWEEREAELGGPPEFLQLMRYHDDGSAKKVTDPENGIGNGNFSPGTLTTDYIVDRFGPGKYLVRGYRSVQLETGQRIPRITRAKVFEVEAPKGYDSRKTAPVAAPAVAVAPSIGPRNAFELELEKLRMQAAIDADRRADERREREERETRERRDREDREARERRAADEAREARRAEREDEWRREQARRDDEWKREQQRREEERDARRQEREDEERRAARAAARALAPPDPLSSVGTIFDVVQKVQALSTGVVGARGGNAKPAKTSIVKDLLSKEGIEGIGSIVGEASTLFEAFGQFKKDAAIAQAIAEGKALPPGALEQQQHPLEPDDEGDDEGAPEDEHAAAQ